MASEIALPRHITPANLPSQHLHDKVPPQPWSPYVQGWNRRKKDDDGRKGEG